MAKRRKQSDPPAQSGRTDDRVAVMSEGSYGAGIDFNNLPAGHPFAKYPRERQERLLNQVWQGLRTANEWHREGKIHAAARCATLTMSLYDGSYWEGKKLP